jgi:hypothetical protein
VHVSSALYCPHCHAHTEEGGLTMVLTAACTEVWCGAALSHGAPAHRHRSTEQLLQLRLAAAAPDAHTVQLTRELQRQLARAMAAEEAAAAGMVEAQAALRMQEERAVEAAAALHLEVQRCKKLRIVTIRVWHRATENSP